MSKGFAVFMGLMLLSACAHRGATRVKCEGPLRPINADWTHSAPVATESAAPAPTAPEHPQ